MQRGLEEELRASALAGFDLKGAADPAEALTDALAALVIEVENFARAVGRLAPAGAAALPGPKKKELVLRVMTRLLEGLPGDQAAFSSAAAALAPSIIDGLVASANAFRAGKARPRCECVVG